MTKQQFHQLMQTYLNGTSSPEEDYFLFQWYDSFQKSSAEREDLSKEEEGALFMKIQSKINSATQESHFVQPQRVNRLLQTNIAASVVLIISLLAGIYFYSRRTSDATKVLNIITSNTQKHRTTLPDGTLVWLNVNSKLSYSTSFIKHREVWLKGEAYFEVKHDAKRSFIVHTADLSVKDLGTIFNLKAYPGKKTETSLIRGSVEVAINQQHQKKIILKPYQKLVLDHHSAAPSAIKVHLEDITPQLKDDEIAEMGWIHPVFSFSNERFENILSALENHFGLKIMIQNPAIRDYRFTGTFRDAGLTTILNALQFSNEFRYRKEGEKTIIIY